MTTVVNIKKSPYDIYIGRGSIYGNPFENGTREEVILKHRLWLLNHERIKITHKGYVYDNFTVLENIKNLKNKVLGCFCKPLACHGDILAMLANKS